MRGRHGFVLGFLLGEVGVRRSLRVVRRLIWLWGIVLLVAWTWFRGLPAPVQSLVVVLLVAGLGFALVAGAQSRRRPATWLPPTAGRRVLGEPGYVYRYVDVDGTLLYIGSTNDPDRRYREHAADRRPFVRPGVRFLVEQLPTREAAFDVEAAAIRTQRPVYNVALNR